MPGALDTTEEMPDYRDIVSSTRGVATALASLAVFFFSFFFFFSFRVNRLIRQ